MLLSVRDQENRVVHGAPQNGKNQFPKTPGQGPSKTPFPGKKIGLNDENGAGGFMTLGGKSTFKAHADAFMTPVGPRNRVPLGGKDTNVKAKQTITFNDPLQQTTKPNKPTGPPSSTKQTTRARRQPRLSITPAKAAVQDEDEYPEIEYIPPPPKELPDYPEDYVRIDVGIVKQTMFRDVHATPLYDAQRKAFFDRLSRYDSDEEEAEVERKMAELFGETKVDEKAKGGGKGTVGRKAGTKAYEMGTKASLAKREGSRPGSALAQAGKPASAITQKAPLHSKKASVSTAAPTTLKPRPKSALGHSNILKADSNKSKGKSAVYRDEAKESKPRPESRSEKAPEEFDVDDFEERMLREALEEEEIDVEKKFKALFTMDDEDEVYQIPMDF
ncbi:hypothetical protein ABW19_dt0202916 [Dactylella cylindrospora]|nr:hypothetical protein ABW19_dt0202916 [Dactylella cylindrospora]